MSPIDVLRHIAVALALVGCTASRVSESARRIAELEQENAELKEQIGVLQNRLRAISSGERHQPISSTLQIDAHVLDVQRERRLVVLNQGTDDGVKVGYVFDVYRGSTFKGSVRITAVQTHMCSGTILARRIRSPQATRPAPTSRPAKGIVASESASRL